MMKPKKKKLYTFRDLLDSPIVKQSHQKRRRLALVDPEKVVKRDSMLMAELDQIFDKLDPVSGHHRAERNISEEPSTSGATLFKKPSRKVRFVPPSSTQSSENDSQRETLAFLTQKDPDSKQKKPTVGGKFVERCSTNHSDGKAGHKTVEIANAMMSPKSGRSDKDGEGCKKKFKQTQLLFGDSTFNHISYTKACRKHKASYRFPSQTSRLSDHVRSQSKSGSSQGNQPKKPPSQTSKQNGELLDSLHSQKSDSYRSSSPRKPSLKQKSSQGKSKGKRGQKKLKKGKKKSCKTVPRKENDSLEERSQEGESDEFSSSSYKFSHQKTLKAKSQFHSKAKNTNTKLGQPEELSFGDGTASREQSQRQSQFEESQDSLLESQMLDSQGFLVDERSAAHRTPENSLDRPLQTIEEESETEEPGKENTENITMQDVSDNEETFVDEELIMLAEKETSTSKTPSRKEGDAVDLLPMWPSTGPFNVVTGGWESLKNKHERRVKQLEQEESFGSSSNSSVDSGNGNTAQTEANGNEERAVSRDRTEEGNHDITDPVTRIEDRLKNRTENDSTRDLGSQHHGRDEVPAGSDRGHFEKDEDSQGRHHDEAVYISSSDEEHDRKSSEKDHHHKQLEPCSGNRSHNSREDHHSADLIESADSPANGLLRKKPTRVPFTNGYAPTAEILVTETLGNTEYSGKGAENDGPMVIPESIDLDANKSISCNFTSDDDFDAIVNSAVDKCLQQLASSAATSSDATEKIDTSEADRRSPVDPELTSPNPEGMHRSSASPPSEATAEASTCGNVENPQSVLKVGDKRKTISLRTPKTPTIAKVSEVAVPPPETASVAVQTDITVLNDNDLNGAFDFYQNAKEFVASYEKEMGHLGLSQSTDSASSESHNVWDTTHAVYSGGLSDGAHDVEKSNNPERKTSPEVDAVLQNYDDLTGEGSTGLKTVNELRTDRIKKKLRKLERKKKKLSAPNGGGATGDNSIQGNGEENETTSASNTSDSRVVFGLADAPGVDVTEASSTSDVDAEDQNGSGPKGVKSVHKFPEVHVGIDENNNHGSRPKKKKKKRQRLRKDPVILGEKKLKRKKKEPPALDGGGAAGYDSTQEDCDENKTASGNDTSDSRVEIGLVDLPVKDITEASSISDVDAEIHVGSGFGGLKSGNQFPEDPVAFDGNNHHGSRRKKKKKRPQLQEDPVILDENEGHEVSHTSDVDTENQLPEDHVSIDENYHHESRLKKRKRRLQLQEDPVILGEKVGIMPHPKKKKKKDAKKRKHRRESTDREGATNSIRSPSSFDLPIESYIPGPKELERLAQEKVSMSHEKPDSSKSARRRKKKMLQRPRSARSLDIAFNWKKLDKSNFEARNGESDREILPADVAPSQRGPTRTVDLQPPPRSPSPVLQLPSPALSETSSIDDFVSPDKDKLQEARTSPRLKLTRIKPGNLRDNTGSVRIGAADVSATEKDGQTREAEKETTQEEAGGWIADTELEQIDICSMASDSEDDTVGPFVEFCQLPDVFVSRMEDSVAIALTVL